MSQVATLSYLRLIHQLRQHLHPHWSRQTFKPMASPKNKNALPNCGYDNKFSLLYYSTSARSFTLCGTVVVVLISNNVQSSSGLRKILSRTPMTHHLDETASLVYLLRSCTSLPADWKERGYTDKACLCRL
jgi:hypothetical protein